MPDESLPATDPALSTGASSDGPHGGRALESLVALTSRVLLREPASDAPSPVITPVPAGSEGRYQVLGEIARGAVGVVFKGHDVDLGRAVAIKVLRPEHADNTGVVQRFVEEAQVGGQLQHPGIVPVYEMGIRDDGKTPWFAMKLVKGRTLSALLAGRKSPADERRRFLSIFEQICQTVAYAHSRGVVHRDLKPANVMIGAFGEVQVVDWGFAKVLARCDDECDSVVPGPERSVIVTVRTESTSSASVVGSVFGTPAYMPPEQARGSVDEVDERSDVFSLGAVLCEILTGRPAYAGDPARLLTMAAQADLGDALVRLAACGAHADIVSVAASCLVAAREARPRSAADVAAKVTAYLVSEEERTRAAQLAAVESRDAAARARIEAESAEERAGHARRQRRLTAAVAAALLVALAITGGAFVWLDRDRTERAADASRDVEAAIAQSVFLRGRALGRADASAAQDALDAAQRADRLASTRDVSEEVRRKTSKSLEETQTEAVRAHKVATLLLRAKRTNYFSWSTGFPGTGFDDRETLRKAIELYPGCAEAHRRLARNLSLRIGDDDDDYRDCFEEAEAECRKAVELDPESTAARSGLADLIRGEYPDSEELAVHEEALIRLDPLQPWWRVMSFERNVQKGNFDEAARIAREVADLDPDEAPLGPRLANVREALGAADEVLRGKALPAAWATKPWDVVEACLFARRYATIARLSESPVLRLAEAKQAPMTGLAAVRVATLRAGLGEGTDAAGVSDDARARFRGLALDGYRALLAGVAGVPAAAGESRPWSARALAREKEGGSWPDSPGGMPRADLMARLPAQEQEKWRDAFTTYDRFGRQSLNDRILWFLLVNSKPGDDITDDMERKLLLHPDDCNYLHMLGVAQYQKGEFDKAVATLTRVEAAYTGSPNGVRPSTLAYLAMALSRLARTDEARVVLDRCRVIAAQPKYAQNQEAQGYVFKAAALLAPEDAGGGK